MVSISTARKLSIAARIAARHAGNTRTGGALLSAARTTATHVGRVLHVLWLEITGFIFLGISAIVGFAFFREYAQYQQGKIGSGRAILAFCVALLFAWFGVTSFWRVGRKKK